MCNADCSACEQFQMQPLSPAVPCLVCGTQGFKDDAKAGVKQLPLLHLIYEVCPRLYGPQEREVRATWLAARYSEKTGKLLAYPKAVKSLSVATSEVHHLVGMALAQRVRTLPAWAQIHRDAQLAYADAIVTMLKGGVAETFMPTLEFELFNGTLKDELEVKEVEGRLEALMRQTEAVATERDHLRRRIAAVEQEGNALANDEQALRGRILAWNRLLEDDRQDANQVRMAFPFLFDQTSGDPFQGNALDFVIDMNTVDATTSMQEDGGPPTDEDARRALARYQAAVRRYQTHWAEHNTLVLRQQEVAGYLERLGTQLRDAKRRLASLDEQDEWLHLYQPVVQGELFRRRTESRTESRDAQRRIQMESLQNDYALQLVNYQNENIPRTLLQAISASPIARQAFLFLHPKLKYEWREPTACRFGKLLQNHDFLETYKALNDAHLLQPGPHAKLGVFVINALRPGSYDERHRELVQTELAKIVPAMDELRAQQQHYGMGSDIVCHSCGATEFCSDPRSWVRDHNPPTAFVELANDWTARGAPDPCTLLALTRYTDGNGRTGKQILLPQCQECSMAQGAITNKVTTILTSAETDGTLPNPLDRDKLLLYIKAKLNSDQDWKDFQRLVLNPGGGWSGPSIDGVRLVTTGGAGSFAGIDDGYLRDLGCTLGCHTCTDVPQQTNPHRNVSWIADHQPPTGLVERGLMELPQIVYPHCMKCSNQQAQLVGKLGRLFDACLGKNFKVAWVKAIAALGHQAV